MLGIDIRSVLTEKHVGLLVPGVAAAVALNLEDCKRGASAASSKRVVGERRHFAVTVCSQSTLTPAALT